MNFSQRRLFFLLLLLTPSASEGFCFSSKPIPPHLSGLFEGLSSKALTECRLHLKKYRLNSDTTPTEVVLALSEDQKLIETGKQIAAQEGFEVVFNPATVSEKTFGSYFQQGGLFESVSTIYLPSIPPELIRQLPRTVKNLTLSCTPSEKCYRIDDDGAQQISEHFLSLEALDLAENQIGPKGLEALVESFKDLKFLNLKGNSVGPVGAKLIADHLSSLTYLNLGVNQIGDQGAIALSTGNLRSLETLVIYHNKIGEVGGQAILNALKSGSAGALPSLRVLLRAGNFGLGFEMMSQLNHVLSKPFSCL